MINKKSFFCWGILFVILILGFLSSPVIGNATVIIRGNSLRLEIGNIDFGTITLSGTTQEIYSFVNQPWAAIDPTGTSNGWHIVISMTTFDSHNGHTLPTARLKIKIPNSTVTTISGNAKPISLADPNWEQISIPPEPAAKIMTATTMTGMGRYRFVPEFQLTIPGNAKADRYSSIITISIVSAP